MLPEGEPCPHQQLPCRLHVRRDCAGRRGRFLCRCDSSSCRPLPVGDPGADDSPTRSRADRSDGSRQVDAAGAGGPGQITLTAGSESHEDFCLAVASHEQMLSGVERGLGAKNASRGPIVRSRTSKQDQDAGSRSNFSAADCARPSAAVAKKSAWGRKASRPSARSKPTSA